MKIEKRQIHNALLESFESHLGKDWRLVSKKIGDVEFLRHSLFPIKVYFFIDSMCWQTPTSPPMTNIWRVHLGCTYSTTIFNEYSGYLDDSRRHLPVAFPLYPNKMSRRLIPEQGLLIFSQDDLDSCMPIVREFVQNSEVQLPRFQNLEEFDDLLGLMDGDHLDSIARELACPEDASQVMVPGNKLLTTNGWGSDFLSAIMYKAVNARIMDKDAKARLKWLENLLVQPFPDLTDLYGEKWQKSFAYGWNICLEKWVPYTMSQLRK